MLDGMILTHFFNAPVILLAMAALIPLNDFLRRRRFDRKSKEAAALGTPLPILLPVPQGWPWFRALVVSAIVSSSYILLFRLMSFIPKYKADHDGGAVLMSFSFLFFVPFVAGVITVYQGSAKHPWRVSQWIMAPWIPIFINLAIAIGIEWEGYICAVFILPPAMISASLGGVAAGLLHRYLHRRLADTTLLCFAAIPVLLVLVEVRLTQPLQTRTVNTEVIIHAPAPVIWRNIERVRAIASTELRPSWANTIGFPWPVEATLSHEGIGGVRQASFERGLNFTETITGWDLNRRIAFTIQADTSAIPSTTLDTHVTVGGRFFDVLDGEYNLQTLPSGDTLLHLSSQERLSTDFNAYAALWSDAVLHDMQTNILHVVKNRCETEALIAAPAQAE